MLTFSISRRHSLESRIENAEFDVRISDGQNKHNVNPLIQISFVMV